METTNSLTKKEINFLNYVIKNNGHTTAHPMCRTDLEWHCSNCIFKTNNNNNDICFPDYTLNKAKKLLKEYKLNLWKQLTH